MHRIQLVGKLILFELGDLVCDNVTADSHVTTQKQQGFNERPYLWETSMFAENISWILLSINVEETKNLGSNCLTHMMV